MNEAQTGWTSGGNPILRGSGECIARDKIQFKKPTGISPRATDRAWEFGQLLRGLKEMSSEAIKTRLRHGAAPAVFFFPSFLPPRSHFTASC